ncbi:MAG: tetratricopeptide repeat protein [Flavobacteriales bacterium]
MIRILTFWLLTIGYNLTSIKVIRAQNLDSLKNLLDLAGEDTSKVNLFLSLSYTSMVEGLYQDEMDYAKQAKALAIKLNWQKGVAQSFSMIGSAYDDFGMLDSAEHQYLESIAISKILRDYSSMAKTYFDLAFCFHQNHDYDAAQNYYSKALSLYIILGDRIKTAETYNNLGGIHYRLGNYPEALNFHFKALKIREQLDDLNPSAGSYNNIANVYYQQHEFEKALKYYKLAYVIHRRLEDDRGIAFSAGNIGMVNADLNRYDSAIYYHQLALNIFDKYGVKTPKARTLYNLSDAYHIMGDISKSMVYCTEALDIYQTTKDDRGIAYAHNKLGQLYLETGKKSVARDHFLKSVAIAKSLSEKEVLSISHLGLSRADSATRNYQSAYNNYKMHIVFRDSLRNEENTKKIIQSQVNYDYEKKKAADSIKIVEERKLNTFKLQSEQQQKKYLFIGLFVLIGFTYFIFNRYRLTQKQKKIIEYKEKETQKQKILIQEKQKEIIDSINYAKRLQNAILPPENLIQQSFPLNYIIYKPKDIVAGDFYWSDNINDRHFIAAADSTGHGVPGALVSIVCSNALNRALKEFNLTIPSEILNKTRELVVKTFEKSENEVKDGMDISLLCIDYKNRVIEWSGSNNPLWYLQNGSMHEIKPDKQPIGKTDNPKPFSNHFIDWQPGTQFYLFTDGFADQFGGQSGKKFKYKPFQELLASLGDHPLNIQSEIIQSTFDTWKGNHEQVDDVCIISIRI